MMRTLRAHVVRVNSTGARARVAQAPLSRSPGGGRPNRSIPTTRPTTGRSTTAQSGWRSATRSRSCSRSTARPAGRTAAPGRTSTRQGGRSPQLLLRRREAVQRQVPPGGTDASYAAPLPCCCMWLAWNEPNNPVFLRRQQGRAAAGWSRAPSTTPRSATRSTRESRPRCSRGEGRLRSHGPAWQQLAPLEPAVRVAACVPPRAAKRAGMRRFDAYAHHPYYGRPSETPTTRPKAKTAVGLGNIGDLTRELTRLYGKKRLWITEYGYQTRPSDRPSASRTPSRPPICARRTGLRARILGST